MKIKSIQIHNWRSIKDTSLECEDLMVIIGQNNHGKSNILIALLFFFGEINAEEHDFCNKAEDLFVEIAFTNLDDHDKGQFKSYLTTVGEIKVRRWAIREDGTHGYNGYRSTPTENFLKEEDIKKPDFDKTPLREFLQLDSGERFGKNAVERAQNAYIEKNKTSLKFEYQLESTPFLGATNVAKGIFGHIFYIPAVKDAADELGIKGKSVFNQLLTRVMNDMSENNEKYKDLKQAMNKVVSALNKLKEDGHLNEERPEEITKLEKKLEEQLETWHTTIEIESTPPDIDSSIKLGTKVLVDDGMKTDVSRKGNGLQRQLIFALIKAWAEVIKEEREKEDLVDSDDTGEKKSARKASKSTFFVFEEPELCLHPQAQKQLFSSLRSLSSAGNQIFLTTHSSFFIHVVDYPSICIAKKSDVPTGTKILQCREKLFGELDEKEQFNLAYWINPDRGELFFANKVILLEGPTEAATIPKLAKMLDCFKYEYTIIDCATKSNIPLYLKLLNGFAIPYAVVYDIDHQAGKSVDAIATADKDSSLIERSINLDLGYSVKFENDIEEEIGMTKEDRKKSNKPITALNFVSKNEYKIPEKLKNKILEIYK